MRGSPLGETAYTPTHTAGAAIRPAARAVGVMTFRVASRCRGPILVALEVTCERTRGGDHRGEPGDRERTGGGLCQGGLRRGLPGAQLQRARRPATGHGR